MINAKHLAFLLSVFLGGSIQLCSQEYFQQEVNYVIDVVLDDEKHFLNGYERIEYFNNSPNLLNEIYFHIWPNAYRDNSTQLNRQKKEDNDFEFNFSSLHSRGYMDSLSFLQDGVAITYEETEEPDIIKLILKKPLLSDEKTIIETPFRVKIPDGRISRFGHTEQAYYITQWYPKPAVYDKNGWNQMSYLDQGEFYSEFGSFDVSITLPENYIVGATGDLQNEEEIEFLKKKAKNDGEIDFGPKHGNPNIPSAKKTKTIQFKQENVHDFAWFADKHFYVNHDKVALPNSGDSVDLWAMFTISNGELWSDIAIEALRDGIYYYSLWNGDYPYKQCTAIDGTIAAGGGMEYPNITIIGNSSNERDLERVLVHEVGHNWFYGILGSNEREFPWMDEGINTYYEHRYFETKYKGEDVSFDFGIPLPFGEKKLADLSYFLGQSRNSEQAIQLHSDEYSSVNYGTIVYEKASFALHYLAAYLGQEEFDFCMQRYFEKWKYKHPNPQDLWAIFEENTTKDVSWFFEKMIHFTSPIDHRICGRVGSNGKNVVVRNMGKYPSPVPVSTYKEGKLIETKWTSPFTGKDTISFKSDNFDEVRIDGNFDVIQANRKNDRWKQDRIFKNWESIGFTGLPFLRERRNTKLGIFPLTGKNANDGFLLGLNMSNLEALKKKWEFSFTPLYAFKSKRIVGYGRVNANLRTDWGPLKFTELFSKASSFTFKNTETEDFTFEKFTAGIELEFRPKRLKRNNQYKLKYEFLQVNTTYNVNEIRLDTSMMEVSYMFNESFRKNYHDVLFTYDDNNTLLQNHSKLNFRLAEDHNRLTIDHLSRLFYKPKRAIDLRIFGGLMFGNAKGSERFFLTGMNNQLNNTALITDFVPIDSTSRSGGQDYLFEDVLLSRTDTVGLWSNQLFMQQGAFKVPIIGLSNDWILATNLDVDFPLPINLGFFASLGWVPERESRNGEFRDIVSVYQEYGLKWTIARDYFTIYFPLIFDNDGDGEMDQSAFPFFKRISFDLRLKKLAPQELRERIPY